MNLPDANQQIRVSVVIPAYNAEKYIQRCLDSVLAQTHPADEIIVVDDGSADHTAEKVKPYGSAVRYIYQDNAGASVARNTGIQAARHEWIAFLDADDEWMPDKLQLQMELLKRNPNLVWVCSNYIVHMDSENRKSECNDFSLSKSVLKGKEYFEKYFEALQYRIVVCIITLVIKRQVLMEAGLFQEGMQFGEDLDLWYRIAYRWPTIGYINQSLAIYHYDIPDSLSKQGDTVQDRIHFVERHLRLATEYGCFADYKPTAIRAIRAWIRGAMFDERIYEIRSITNRFDEYLTPIYKTIVYLLTIYPRGTMRMCRMISKMVRFLKIRKRVVRPPKKITGVIQRVPK